MPLKSSAMSPELQAQFAAAVLQGDPQARDILLAVATSGSATTLAALHIHASTTRETLTDALRESFPTVAKLITARRFARLAADYIRLSPPRRAALWDWGDNFADFLAQRNSPATLIGVARLDKAWHESFCDEDAAALPAQALSALSPDELAEAVLPLHPTARLLSLPPGANAAWRKAAALPLAIVVGSESAPHALLTRPDAQVQALALNDAEFQFLAALAEGVNLLDAFERAAALDATFDLQSALSRLFAAGAFASPLPQKDI